MKEIYDWVPWFKELSSTIAENGEAFLVERAKQVPWKEDGSNPALLLPGDENVNPFPFIDTEALSLFRSLSTRAYSARALGLPRSRPRSTDSRGGEARTIPPAPPGTVLAALPTGFFRAPTEGRAHPWSIQQVRPTICAVRAITAPLAASLPRALRLQCRNTARRARC